MPRGALALAYLEAHHPVARRPCHSGTPRCVLKDAGERHPALEVPSHVGEPRSRSNDGHGHSHVAAGSSMSIRKS